jgi:ribosomal protein S3
MFDAGLSKVEIKRKLNHIFLNIYLVKPFLFFGTNADKLHILRNKLAV